MLEHVRQTMAELTNKPSSDVFIQDLLAVDTAVPVNVTGGLAGEFSLEQAVGIASMVKSDRLQMAMIAREIEQSYTLMCRWAARSRSRHLWCANHAGHHEAAGDPRPWRRLHRRLHYHAAGQITPPIWPEPATW
jgi:Tfp pilus assembly ATPase PilU